MSIKLIFTSLLFFLFGINFLLGSVHFTTEISNENIFLKDSLSPTKLIVETISDNDCHEDSSGMITLSVVPDTVAFIILWNTGDTTLEINNLESGIYSATLTDINDCVDSIRLAIRTLPDTIPPIFKLKDILYEIPFDGSVPIFYEEDFVEFLSDNCKDQIQIAPNQFEFECTDSGIHFFPITITDAQGNDSHDLLNIELVDNIPPVILCPANIEAFNCDSIFFSFPFVSENCLIRSFEQISGLPSGSIFPQGRTDVTYEAVDASGNVSSCTTFITVDYGIDYSFIPFEVSCYGDDDGAIIINAKARNGLSSVEVTNYNGNLLRMPAGEYYVQIIDSMGCSILDTFHIIQPESIIIDSIFVIEEEDFDSNNGWINVDISGGTPPYTYLWKMGNNIIDQSEDIDNLSSGYYHLIITDSYGCRFISDLIPVGIPTNLSETAFSPSFNIYPNPADHLINFNLSDNVTNIGIIELFDVSGNIVYKEDVVKSIGSINTLSLANGIYFIKAIVNNRSVVKKLIIAH